MGQVYPGVPYPLALEIRDRFGVRIFIETGTYLGESARWAAQNFDRVWTIEKSEHYWSLAEDNLKGFENVNRMRGDSRVQLDALGSCLDGPALVWLDAHWSGGATYGSGDECPVLGELRAIGGFQQETFILIDDARLFLMPPPRPHNPEQWPDLTALLSALEAAEKPRYVAVVDDVIAAVPDRAKSFLVAYCQGLGTQVAPPQPGKTGRLAEKLSWIPHRLVGKRGAGMGKVGEPLVLTGEHDTRAALVGWGLSQRGQPLRLHLGCGEVRLPGYVNIDYPPAQHSLQTLSGADVFADIMDLRFKPGEVDEVRLHHVFEHFDRPTALALLGRWHRWLKPGGILILETPDLWASLESIRSDSTSYPQKAAVLRHLYGSHEAQWAAHLDGWFEEKFRRVLSAMGYENLVFEYSQWGTIQNILVRAEKIAPVSDRVLRLAAHAVLRDSMVDRSPSEERLWRIWTSRLDEHLGVEVRFEAPPVVSIFIPVYNRENILPATLDSLLAQSFPDFEIIIADDGSTDRTLEISYDYARRDRRVRVFPLPHDGEVAARNAALEVVHPDARYLINHDSDDLSLPDKLSRLVAYLEAHPEVAAVGCQSEYFNDAGECLGQPDLECEPARIRATFGEKNSMIHSATLIRREVFNRVGKYRQAYRSVDDYDFFARALCAGFELANLPDILHRIRLHPDSIGSTQTLRQSVLAERVRSQYVRCQAAKLGWRVWPQLARLTWRRWRAQARYSSARVRTQLERWQRRA